MGRGLMMRSRSEKRKAGRKIIRFPDIVSQPENDLLRIVFKTIRELITHKQNKDYLIEEVHIIISELRSCLEVIHFLHTGTSFLSYADTLPASAEFNYVPDVTEELEEISLAYDDMQKLSFFDNRQKSYKIWFDEEMNIFRDNARKRYALNRKSVCRK